MDKNKRGALTAVDVFFLLGAVLISVGVGMLACWPAGIISLGVFNLAAAWLTEPPERKDGDARR